MFGMIMPAVLPVPMPPTHKTDRESVMRTSLFFHLPKRIIVPLNNPMFVMSQSFAGRPAPIDHMANWCGLE